MKEEIKNLRKKIDETDFEIISLLSERMRLAKEIASEKIKKNIPILQKKREKEAISKRVNFGEKLNLKPLFTEKIFLLLFRESKKIQQSMKRGSAKPPALTKGHEL